MFRVHKSECKKNVKHFKTKNSLKYKKKQKKTEYLKTAEMNECLPYVSKDDIPDLDIREKLKQVDPLLFALDINI